jgi:pyrimidine deaminase RibD-like protein
MKRDRYFLELALEEEKVLYENTYPVGAVIVDENQNIIAKGRNRVHPQQDARPTQKSTRSVMLANQYLKLSLTVKS